MLGIIRDIDQGSDEWLKLRLGSIGGSGIKKVTAKGAGKTRSGYLYKKADEILSGRSVKSYQNEDMVLGTDSEQYSREAYEIITGSEVEQVTIIKLSPHKHESPDGLVGNNGKIEIKNINGPGYVEVVSKGTVPTEHIKQIQWGLFVSEREWCDYIQACWIREDGEIIPRHPDLPIWVKRVYRDEKLIKELNDESDRFIDEMWKVVEKMRQTYR